LESIRTTHQLDTDADIEAFVNNLAAFVDGAEEKIGKLQGERDYLHNRLHAADQVINDIRTMCGLDDADDSSALEAIQRMKIDLKTAVDAYQSQEREIEKLRAVRDEWSDLVNRLGAIRMHLKADPNKDLVEVAKSRMDEIVNLKDIVYGDPRPATSPGRDSALLDMLFDIVDGNVPWDDIKRYLVGLRAA